MRKKVRIILMMVMVLSLSVAVGCGDKKKTDSTVKDVTETSGWDATESSTEKLVSLETTTSIQGEVVEPTSELASKPNETTVPTSGQNETTTSTSSSIETASPTQKPTETSATTQKPTQAAASKPAENTDTEYARLEKIYWECMSGNWNLTKAQHDAAIKEIIRVVKDIMAKYSTDFEREMAVNDYICDVCTYDYASLNTGLTQAGQTPYGVLIEKKAVCGGYANTFNICMNMMGIKCYYVQIEGVHAWNQVCIDGDWYEVDCTNNDSNGRRMFFNLTTEEMGWKEGKRPVVCNGGKYGQSYFKEKGKQELLKANSDKYFTAEEPVKKYIQNQLSAGKTQVEVYTTESMYKKIMGIDYSTWNMTDYYDSEETYIYTAVDGVRIDDVYCVNITFKKVSELKSKGNYFDNVADFQKYLKEQEAKGATSFEAYFPTGVEPGDYDNWSYGYVQAGDFYNCWVYYFSRK